MIKNIAKKTTRVAKSGLHFNPIHKWFRKSHDQSTGSSIEEGLPTNQTKTAHRLSILASGLTTLSAAIALLVYLPTFREFDLEVYYGLTKMDRQETIKVESYFSGWKSIEALAAYFFSEGKYGTSIEILNVLMANAENQENHRLRSKIGQAQFMALWKKKDISRALSKLQKTIEINPKDSDLTKATLILEPWVTNAKVYDRGNPLITKAQQLIDLINGKKENHP